MTQIPIHITRPYNFISNTPFLRRIYEKYFRLSYLRFFLEDFRFKLRNFRKGYPLNLFQSILIETNSFCNRKCSYCPVSKYPRPVKKMPERLFNKIISELKEINYSGIICFHFYNEPLTDKRLPNFVKHTKDNLPKSKIILYTNGDLLSPEKFLELVKTGVDIFEITEHGDSPSANVKKVFNLISENKQLAKYINYRKNLYLENRAGLVDVKQPQRKRCTSSAVNFTINYKGQAVLCCQDYFGDIIFGEVSKERIIDIWNKSPYKKIREENKKGIFKLPICKRCVGI